MSLTWSSWCPLEGIAHGGLQSPAWQPWTEAFSHLRFDFILSGPLLLSPLWPGPAAEPGEAGETQVREALHFDSDAENFAGGDFGEEGLAVRRLLSLRPLQAPQDIQDVLPLRLVLQTSYVKDG